MQTTSKLQRVRDALTQRRDIHLVYSNDGSYFRGRQGETLSSTYEVQFWVAPKDGLYTAHQLQIFLNGLVPRLKADSGMEFQKHDSERTYLELGHKRYDDVVGKTRTFNSTLVQVTDEELQKALRLEKGEKAFTDTYSDNIRRITFINVFPNKEIALNVLKHGPFNERTEAMHSRNYVSLETLARYVPELAKKLKR